MHDQRKLTPREQEIAERVYRGLQNQQIADELVLSPRTIENHIARIRLKIGAPSRTGVAAWVRDTRANSTTQPTPSPPVPAAQVDDVPGHNHKPDPMKAATPADLERMLREFWVWVGMPSTRDISRRSGGLFSHATISKLLYEKPKKPPLKLAYVQGLVHGCGANAEEEQRWVTAWRAVHHRMG
jgi:DNA-binding CsgD family transcriptional regulator